jgi:hypothetical protein
MLHNNELESYIEQLALPGSDYPIASNRGVINPFSPLVFSHIDYIQATMEAPRNLGDGNFSIPFLDDVFRMTRERGGIKNYRYGSELSPSGSLFWNDEHNQNPGYLVLTGDDVAMLRSMKKMSDDKIIAKLKRPVRKFTRIDFAINITAGGPDELLIEWNAGRVQTRAKTCDRIDRHGAKKGYTLYVGSRGSDKYIRCYDKAAELGLLYSVLTRIEMQTGGDVADRLAAAMSRDGTKAVGKQAIRDFAMPHNLEWWEQATRGADVDLQLTPSKLTSFSRWLNEQVYPAIEKRIQAEQETEAIEAFTKRLMGLFGEIQKE